MQNQRWNKVDKQNHKWFGTLYQLIQCLGLFTLNLLLKNLLFIAGLQKNIATPDNVDFKEAEIGKSTEES